MIRILIVGYCFGIRSERRLCEEVHLNLAYRWFCSLGLTGCVFRAKSATDSGMKSATDSDLISAIPI